MARFSMVAIVLPILLASFMAAQASPSSTQAAKGPPKIKIVFPRGASLDNVWLEYGLFRTNGGRVYIGLPGSTEFSGTVPPFDPVGGQGHVVGLKESRDRYYEVVALEDGNPVDRFKALVWARGCRMAEFDVAVGTDDALLTYTCSPLRSITLTGHVQQFDFAGMPAMLTVSYHTFMSCDFFSLCKDTCLVSCPGMQIPAVGSAQINTDGTFKVELPDFIDIDNKAEFAFLLNDVVLAPGYTNYRHVALEPELKDFHAQMGGLNVAATYPSDLILVPRKYNPKPSSASPAR